MSVSSKKPAPFGVKAFGEHLARLDPGVRVGIAFSGGPDSLALLILAAQWARRSKNRTVIAFTVDHGLRAEAAAEAKHCARVAKSLGVAHRILRWRGEKPGSGIQAAARAARYALLVEACAREKLDSLLVAHHLEDQAETFLLRLARGSGVDGLAGMVPSRQLHDAQGAPAVRLLRPLLDVSREALRAVVVKSGLKAIEDPSNDNPKFDRVKVRQMAEALSSLGLSARRLADTASNMARAREALEAQTDAFFQGSSRLHDTGCIEIDAGAFLALPSEIALRALADALKYVGASDYPPRFDALMGIYDELKAGKLGRGRTLNGCKLVVQGQRLFVLRELSAALKARDLVLGGGKRSGVWDGRFIVTLLKSPGRGGSLAVRALGPQVVRDLVASGKTLPEGPKASFAALPGLWDGQKLVAAPHFAMADQGYVFEAEIRALGRFGRS